MIFGHPKVCTLILRVFPPISHIAFNERGREEDLLTLFSLVVIALFLFQHCELIYSMGI